VLFVWLPSPSFVYLNNLKDKNMTKTIVLGAEHPKTEKTKIKFVKVLTGVYEVEESDFSGTPEDCNYIELVSKDYALGMDLMFAYDDPNKREHGVLYIGYWNDGIV
jgi:hypothetical protein